MAAQPEARGQVGSVFALPALRTLPAEALTLVVEREASFAKLDVAVNRTLLENLRAVLARGSGSIRFGAAEVEASCGRVRIGAPAAAMATAAFEPKVLNVPGVTPAGHWRVHTTTAQGPPGEPASVIDAAQARGALRVRPLAPGDRIVHGGILRKVSDLLTNEKVPAWERRGLVAIADAERVLAIPALALPRLSHEPQDALYVRVVPVPQDATPNRP
ncbi:MAG: tRNA lysidine(34) synthetase TilS [Tepidiformaceae bacterium]